MTDIYHQLTRHDFRQMDTDSLTEVRNQYSDAFDGIMAALRAMGSMAFWARNSDEYSDEQAFEDYQAVAESLMYLPRIAEAFKFNAIDADFELRCRDGIPVSPNTQTKTQIKNGGRRMSRYHVENTPDGIKISQHTAERLYAHVDLIPYADVMPLLDAGEWDEDTDLALAIAVKWGESDYDYTNEDALLMWRWLIAYAFNREQREANGTVTVEWRPGEFKECAVYQGEYGAINLYLAAERFAMANNIEGALIEKYGAEQGTINAVQFYAAMRGENGGLSEMGREVLSELHDGFIQQIYESGMPEAPTAH